MLFKILKLFGLDIPAKIEAAKVELERRVEQATDHVKQVAQEAAVIAAFLVAASLTAAMAVGVSMIALYRWTAEAYGAYAGLAVVGAILIVVSVIFVAAATIKSRSLADHRTKLPHDAAGAVYVAADADPIGNVTTADTAATVDATAAVAPTSVAAPISASDLAEPLAHLLSRVVRYPSIGNPVADELIGTLRATAHGTTNEAIERATDVIRHGDRANLLVVLTGAAFVGWLLSHHSRNHA